MNQQSLTSPNPASPKGRGTKGQYGKLRDIASKHFADGNDSPVLLLPLRPNEEGQAASSSPDGVSLADFEIKSILGQGSNGTVYKAI
jgi:serine/threonine protein kinase